MFNDGSITDVVLKVPDLYVGLGDKFLVSGTDFDNAEDLEQLILADKEMQFVVLSDFHYYAVIVHKNSAHVLLKEEKSKEYIRLFPIPNQCKCLLQGHFVIAF